MVERRRNTELHDRVPQAFGMLAMLRTANSSELCQPDTMETMNAGIFPVSSCGQRIEERDQEVEFSGGQFHIASVQPYQATLPNG